MPKNKIKKKEINDKFYTKAEIVDLCLSKLSKYILPDDILVEPSSGAGAFYNKIKHKKIGIDIEPECDGIIKTSWFDYVPPNNCVIVGNPPFGSRNDLSKKFIEHGKNYAKIIAFVLPQVFKKESLQKVFPENWSLVETIDLPHNSFTVNDVDYHVPCIFQIWIKDYNGPDYRESKVPLYETTDFSFCDNKNATYFIFGAAPNKIIDANKVLTNNRGYYIICSEEIKTKLETVDWKSEGLSSVSGGAAWYSKKQIINIYGKYHGSKQQK